MTSMDDPGPVSREDAAEASEAILAAHREDKKCWRCPADGGVCPAIPDAGRRLAAIRYELDDEDRTNHPLFDWRPGGVREALRTGGAVLVTRDNPPRIVTPEETQ